MKVAEFFDEVEARGIEVHFDHASPAAPQRLSNEALFHLPLIAITILMMSKGHAKPTISELGQLVGECYERAFPAFRGSAQHLGWSASLRVRTVQALSFLEQAQLVEIESVSRKISASEVGRKVINRALAKADDLAETLAAVERNFKNIKSERQLRLGGI
jgi:hypothetical protein